MKSWRSISRDKKMILAGAAFGAFCRAGGSGNRYTIANDRFPTNRAFG
jgi:hypothetical protein